MRARRPYLAAASRDWALPFYDPVVKLLGGDRARRLLIDQADLHSGHRVVEIGCGTGTLLLQIARAFPDVALIGLEPDPNALVRARTKAAAAHAAVHLDRAFADALPYSDATFDRAFSCFVFHHLETVDEKRDALREVRRVLRRGGRLQLLDFVHAAKARFDALSWVHPGDGLADNTEAGMLRLLRQAGLAKVSLVRRATMLRVLSLGYFQATAD